MANERPKAIIFDIIETVFSLEPIRKDLVDLGLAEGDLETWFAFGLRDAFALDATQAIRPFPEILKAALRELLAVRNIAPDGADLAPVFETMRSLPAHPEVRQALDILAETGIPLYALSNGAASSTRNLLEGEGLTDRFAGILSVETVGRFKPSGAVYRHGIEETGEAAGDVLMVAVHAWDTHGAKAAGMRSAFVARGQAYPATMLPPDLVGADLVEIAEAIRGL